MSREDGCRAPRLFNRSVAHWTFLTHHAHVLLAVAVDSDATIRDIADEVGISRRRAIAILNDLVDEGYVKREQRGRGNHYTLRADMPLRHPSNAGHSVGELIAALTVAR